METSMFVLAFDVERSGPCETHDTIAIGASVLDSDFQEHASLLLEGYIPGETNFDPECWEEFWTNHLDVLENIKYTGDKHKGDREKEMIEAFHAFRQLWEKRAAESGKELVLASDNPVFDGGSINSLMAKYLPEGTRPIPYTATTPQTYEHLVSVDDVRNGMFMHYEMEKKMVGTLYDIPPKAKLHTHTPDCDAYSIAHDLLVAYGINNNSIKLRKCPHSAMTKADADAAM